MNSSADVNYRDHYDAGQCVRGSVSGPGTIASAERGGGVHQTGRTEQ